MQIAFHLDHPYVDTEIARHANEHGLTAQPLSQFCTTRNACNGLLLGYCGFTEDEMKVALATLGGVLAA